MGIIEEREKREGDVVVSEDLAHKLYNKQVAAITNVSHTDWYKEIKEYWIRERDIATEALEIVNKDNLANVQLKRKISNDFVTFLNNLEAWAKNK